MIYLNGTPLPTTRFPDNTSQVWKIPGFEDLLKLNQVQVSWDYTHEAEFLEIAMLKDLLDSMYVKSSLYIKYLPYGRQDKEVSNEATFALRTFAKLLNTLAFNQVVIMDPHSLVAIDLINNSRAEYPKHQIYELILRGHCDVACYPDKGARTKYSQVYGDLIGARHAYGEKVRDQLTGNILKYDLVGGGLVKSQKVLIIDRLAAKGFASINVVFGIGSYTYQYNTRDTFGYALKSTMCVINGQEKQIFKDPKTDNGIKKSQKGRVVVLKDGKSFKFVDGFSLNDNVAGDQLVEVFRDGKLLVDESFAEIRARLASFK